MQRIERRVRHLFHSRRGFLRRARPVWWLRVIFQSQRKEPRIVLATHIPQLTRRPKSIPAVMPPAMMRLRSCTTQLDGKLGSQKLLAGCRRTDQCDRQLCSQRRSAGRAENHGSCAHARHELGGLSTLIGARKSRVSLSVISATVPSLPPPTNRMSTGSAQSAKGFGRLDGDASIASSPRPSSWRQAHTFDCPGDSQIPADGPIRIERCHAWINQHRDFCRFLRRGMLLAALVS